jgi:lipid II:glycine glycyltransferase (peptidoglycan interpeptide bridge formation enzyme)
MKNHGFTHNSNVKPYRTFLLDLSPSLEELRKNLDHQWRKRLNSAEKSNLVITKGVEEEEFSTFQELYYEMLSRKKFEPGIDDRDLRKIQSDSPDFLKMKIFICSHDGKPIASYVISAIGEVGVPLLSATGNEGLRLNGSYLIQWEIIKWLKEKGFMWHDLGGIDPIGNPGVYNFKRGIAGKNGKEVTQLGQFFHAGSPIGYCLSLGIDGINHIRAGLRKRLKSLR